MTIWYDKPPHTLTLGQLGRTHAYRMGQIPAEFIRKPLLDDFFYTEDSSEYTWESEVDPYEVPHGVPPPHRISVGDVEKCFEYPSAETQHTATVPWITASVWEVSGTSFGVEADLSRVVAELGDGVYTVLIWGEKDGETVNLANYSIFVD